MFPREHEFTALVIDCGPRRYLAAIALRAESNNLESRIERVSGMYFLEKLAGRLGKRDERVSNVLRKEGCPGSREREHLQAMHYWLPKWVMRNKRSISRQMASRRAVSLLTTKFMSD